MRAQAYAELGIGTVCRTSMMADGILGAMGLPGLDEASVRPGAAHDHPPIALSVADRPGKG
jgi:hypothetical protein